MTPRSTIVRTTVFIVASALIGYAQAPTALTSLPSSAYEHIYRHVLHLQAVDAASAAAGKPTNLSAYYKNLANLTQAQADAMASLSQSAVAALSALDQQAHTLILQWRAQMPAKLLPGQKPPSPPAQLAALQAARNALLDSYHSQLMQSLGQTAFNSLEQALINNYKVGSQAAGQPGH
jgi:hypothetical protein